MKIAGAGSGSIAPAFLGERRFDGAVGERKGDVPRDARLKLRSPGGKETRLPNSFAKKIVSRRACWLISLPSPPHAAYPFFVGCGSYDEGCGYLSEPLQVGRCFAL